MEAINAARQRVWQLQPEGFLDEAVIDVDGSLAPTLGECKEGMDISYKGIWGYHPLLVSLANTKEVLYLVNRPGNVPTTTGSCPGWTAPSTWSARTPKASSCGATPTFRTPRISTAGPMRA